MQAIFAWVFGSAVPVIWDLLKPLLKSFGKGLIIYQVVSVVINYMFSYADLYMAPVVLFLGDWWLAVGGDVVVKIVMISVKLKITLKLLQATSGQK